MANTQTATNTPKAPPAAAKATRSRAKKAPQPVENQVGPNGANLAGPTEKHEVPPEQRQGERRQAQQNLAAQFQPSNMETPAAHTVPELNEDDRKRIAFEEQVKVLAQQMGVDASAVLNLPSNNAPTQATQRAERASKNNITQPAEGTVSRSIWDLADKLSAAKNGQGFAEIAELRADASMRQVNEATLKTQYARWRSYHGLKGRQTASPEPVQQQEQPYDGPERRAAA